LPGIDGQQQHKTRACVQYRHKENGDGDAEQAPVGRSLPAGALAKQLALTAPAAIRAPPRRAQ
jgi:hypothetical protein